MLNPLVSLVLVLNPGDATPLEPAGVRPSGAIPSLRAEPFPPDWLRLESHVLADPECRHYGYEAYSGEAHWLARYVMLPERGEGYLKIEQVFLFPRERGRGKAERIDPAKIQVDPSGQGLQWKGQFFKLVDRRDLIQD
ncbi:MAG: hypothetical protein HY014_07700 [Acidobacteria bacterium]|nr:hypothetical protein [Acidobacteriota bacterium]MBI3488036.1 hypothetical protein [Acidobacteriota bacterium]